MKLSDYLENHRGVGILSTANGAGEVNGAVYAKPHVIGRDEIAFIMRERLSRANLKQNVNAHYLFVEEGGKSEGIRLHLDMIEENDDQELVGKLSRRPQRPGDGERRYLVTFKVRKALALLGGSEVHLD